MKRFLVLHGDSYYPSGWDDYTGSFDFAEDAKSAVECARRESRYRWAQIVDTQLEPPTSVADGTYRDGRWEWGDQPMPFQGAVK